MEQNEMLRQYQGISAMKREAGIIEEGRVEKITGVKR